MKRFLVAAIFLLAGGAGLSFAAILYRQTAAFLATAVRTEGVVVEVVERDSADGPVHAPVFVFADAEGIDHEVESLLGSNQAVFRRGERVAVAYPQDDPGRARIACFSQLWLPALVLGIVGMAFTVVGVLVVVHRPATRDPGQAPVPGQGPGGDRG